jgi:hypothetical protein
MARDCNTVDGDAIVAVMLLCIEVATLDEESGTVVAVVWAFAIHFAFTRLPWPGR